MFGGVDRSALDDIGPNVVARPKRNAAIPARFINRIYAVSNHTLSSLVSDMASRDRNITDVMCLYFDSEMKKTRYVCFPCWEENGPETPYSRSYDLIAHIINAHGKHPGAAT